MWMPGFFGESLFDEWMDFPWERARYNDNSRKSSAAPKKENSLMKTDVRELDDSYELDMELPGFKKEEITVKLENGYLTVAAVKTAGEDAGEKKGSYLRRERYMTNCSRSFYVGEDVRQSEIRARFENGILRLSIPKKDKRQVEQNGYISING